jgi:hypothetical protein
LVKNRIAYYQGNSPTFIFETVTTLAKGTEILAHKITLLIAEIRIFRKTNKTLSKCRRAKKTRIRQGGIFTIKDTRDILAQRDTKEQVQHNKHSREDKQNKRQSTR